MDEHTLRILEYDRLLDQLADLAQSDPGAAFCLSMAPDLDQPEARQRWALIDEAKAVFSVDGVPPIGHLPDVFPVLNRMGAEGIVLKS